MVHLVRTSWQGLSGGNGLTQLAVDTAAPSFGALGAGDAQDAVNAVRAFWDACKTYLPNELTLTVSPVVDYYLADSGELSGSTTAATPPTSVVGGGTGDYSMAAGVKASLNTGVILNGRRVRGSIFLVPAVGAFSATGGVGATPKATLTTAGTGLMAALSATGLTLGVWSRPIPDGKPYGPRDGVYTAVTGFEISEKTAVLRGRRD